MALAFCVEQAVRAVHNHREHRLDDRSLQKAVVPVAGECLHEVGDVVAAVRVAHACLDEQL